MEVKKFRLGGAAGYSLIAYGSKTRSGTLYEKIFLGWNGNYFLYDVTTEPPIFPSPIGPIDRQFVDGLLTEARKHLAMAVCSEWAPPK